MNLPSITKIVLGLLFVILLGSLFSDKKTKDSPVKVEIIPSQKGSTTQPISRGSRVLGIGLTEGSIGFGSTFSLAQSVGSEIVEIPVSWGEVETSPGVFVSKWLPIANDFYPKNATKVALTLNPIDTNNLLLPKDLKDKSFDDEEVIRRYKSFVDFAAASMKDTEVYYVAVGNEIDIYLQKDSKRWQEYTSFYKKVAPYVQEKFPRAIVGSKVTFKGAVDRLEMVKQLVQSDEGLLVTYYPLTDGFIVHDPSRVVADFKDITELYPSKKIYFTEIGYPSGELNGSSEDKQADFIRSAFSAWDLHKERIPLLNFVWMHDISSDALKGYAKYYGSNNKSFTSYLGTLGLRTYEGKDKKAFTVFREEVKKRGW